MLEGRTVDQKRELALSLTRETARIANCTVESVQVVITEVARENWAVAGVLAAEAKKEKS